MADPVHSEVVLIINAQGLSRGVNVLAWKEWAGSLPVRTIGAGLDDVLKAYKHLSEFTHAWVVDANYLPYPTAFRPTMRKHMNPNSTYAMFSVKKPLAARHFYDEKWTTDKDEHDKFGGVRYIVLQPPVENDKEDSALLGKKAEFVHFATSRLGFPYCVFQLSSNEPDIVREANFATVKDVYAGALNFHSENDILNSHIAMAKRSDTEMFLVFDADFQLDTELTNDEFKPWEQDSVHVWYARNPINGLEYGHGGPKAFNKDAFLKLEGETLDVTTSASSSRLLVHKQVVGTHAFNWSAFSSWRTAFREVAKLTFALNTISDPDEYEEAYIRRETWTTEVDSKASFATECVCGARDGKFWAERVNSREDAVQINDFAWLRLQYTKRYGEKD